MHVEPAPARAAEAARLLREAEDLRARLQALQGERLSLLDQARRADQELALRRAEAEAASIQSRTADAGAARAAERAASMAARVRALRRRAAMTARALYVEGKDAPLLRALTQPSGGADVASALLARDAELALDLRSAERASLEAASEAARRASAARQASADAAGRRAALERQAGQREAALRRIASAVARDRDAAQEMEAAAAELLGSLAPEAIARRPSPALAAAARTDLPGLEARRGRLAWPLDGRPRVIERWGPVTDPVRGTKTFRHGVALAARRGESIRAVAPGRVLFVDWYKAFGRCLVLDHGGGFLSVYAHADAFTAQPGQDVDEGEEIGAAGDTGSLEGPRLWFQIQRRGESVDPLPWLRP